MNGNETVYYLLCLCHALAFSVVPLMCLVFQACLQCHCAFLARLFSLFIICSFCLFEFCSIFSEFGNPHESHLPRKCAIMACRYFTKVIYSSAAGGGMFLVVVVRFSHGSAHTSTHTMRCLSLRLMEKLLSTLSEPSAFNQR